MSHGLMTHLNTLLSYLHEFPSVEERFLIHNDVFSYDRDLWYTDQRKGGIEASAEANFLHE